MSQQLIFRPADFPNQLSLLELTSSEIESQVRNYPLTFIDLKDDEVEREIKFPEFVTAFYKYVYKSKTIPQQAEFYEFYITSNISHFKNAKYDKRIYKALQARIFRAYPSFVRDLYFNKVLTEKVPGFKVVYNVKLDVSHDIDTLIVYKSQFWAACLYTPTSRAYEAREWKESRHDRFDNMNYVEFPVEFDNNRKTGNFFLYGDKELEILQKIIKHE